MLEKTRGRRCGEDLPVCNGHLPEAVIDAGAATASTTTTTAATTAAAAAAAAAATTKTVSQIKLTDGIEGHVDLAMTLF